MVLKEGLRTLKARWVGLVWTCVVGGLLLLGFGAPAVAAAGVVSVPGNILWVDLPANARNLADHEAVDAVVARMAAVHVDGIVLDVKAYTGFVAYESQLAPHISGTRIRNHQGLPEGFDLLQAFVEASRRHGLKIYASINTFSEGNVPLKDGPLFTRESMAHWPTMFQQGRMYVHSDKGHTFTVFGWNEPRREDRVYLYSRDHGGPTVTPTSAWGVDVVVENGRVVQVQDRVIDQNIPVPTVPVDGYVLSGTGEAREALLQLQLGDTLHTDFRTENVLVPATQNSAFTAFVNPIIPEVQNYVMGIIRELLQYDIDGIVLDRARYANVLADFSPLSRQQFEAYLGRSVERWPQDVLVERLTPAGKKLDYGPLAAEWFHWRARNIQQFFARVERFVKHSNPALAFGVYVGSWYPHYYAEGVNWGRRGFQPELDWVTSNYYETGYADHLDFLMAGAYYYHVTVEEAVTTGLEDWRSVEGGLDWVELAIGDVTPGYGSLFLLDYQHDVGQFRRAVEMVRSRDMGIMLFDLYYIEQYGWWDVVAEVLR